jgi:response regulator RpfG family c-di-GMP phosphodiesterase
MKKPLRVLMVEDSEDDALLTIHVLRKGGYDPVYERVETAEAMRKALEKGSWDVIICDYQMPKFNGFTAIALLKETNIDIPLIIVSGAIGEETAVECMRSGANDYVMKNNLSRLTPAVERELKEEESRVQRKQAEEALRKSRDSVEQLAEERARIAEIGRIVGSTLDINQVYERVATEARKLIPYDRLLVNRKITQDGEFIVDYIAGVDNPRRRIGDLYPSRGSATGVAMGMRTGILIQPDDAEEIKDLYPNLYETFKTGLRSTMSVPLIAKDEVIGTMNFRSKKLKAYTEKDLQLAESIGMQIAGAIANAQLFADLQQMEKKLQGTLDSLRRAVGTTMQVMVSAVETRDPYTSGHQTRSANLARAIAMEMELPQDRIDGIRMAGSIHDIGKLSIPAEILSKPTKLSEIELSLIKEHANKGYEILKNVESAWPLAEIVYQHHERMDGSGYPRNLKGEEILLEARILTVADVVEAMASHRPYRPGLGIDAALNEIEKNKGLFYDNAVADACLRLFREKGFQLEDTRL